MNAKQILLVLGIVMFALGAFNVPGANWLCAGLAFVTAAFTV
jgi:hypothetical protein